MRRFHVALSVHDIEASVRDYTNRMGCAPCVVVPNEYALWRAEGVNLSIRKASDAPAGTLRHLGWEDTAAQAFTKETDVNHLVWEHFSASNQADEILRIWPKTQYDPAI